MSLGAALCYIALCVAVSSAFLSAGLAMTRATMHRLSQTYIAIGYQRAASSLQQTFAQDLRGGSLPDPLPTFTPIPPACVNNEIPCRYTTSETIALTEGSTPNQVDGCDVEKTNCASNVQANAYVNESRLTARITVTVSTAAGAALAERKSDIIFRTMNTPPYVVLAGTRDWTFDDIASMHALGDDGGLPPATPNPCQTSAANTSDDTVVRVQYRNTVSNACTDGSTWSTSSYDIQNATAQDWPP
jgi:hypothetical protein